MKDERVPHGQRVTKGFPTLHVEYPMDFNPDTWRFTVSGQVDSPLKLTWNEFLELPSTTIESDFHCVTGWSKLDNEWEGVLGRVIYDMAEVRDIARHVIMIADSGYSSNIRLEYFLRDDTLLAYKWEGRPLETNHGGPLRSIISHLWAWKSVKWLIGLKFVIDDEPGYWETRGYHNEGNPWKGQRYSF